MAWYEILFVSVGLSLDVFSWRQLCLWALLTSVDTFLTGIGMGFLNTWSICAENAQNMRKTGINVRRSCGINSYISFTKVYI